MYFRINVKLGGINTVPDPQDISWLTDPVNPMMVMGKPHMIVHDCLCSYTFCSPGADISHPPPGAEDRPSFTSLVGSVDSNGVKYVSRIGIQSSARGLIEGMEDMCMVRVWLMASLDDGNHRAMIN
jgi:eukaryotic translation initiation factor 2C